MINEDLLSKFDSIQDLPVSEELLGAYLEDNLPANEMSEVENAISLHPFLNDLAECAEDYCIYSNDYETIDDLYLENSQLPILPSDGFIEFDSSFHIFNNETEDYGETAACATDNDDDYTHNDGYGDSELGGPFDDSDFHNDSLDNNDEYDYE